MDSGQPNVKVIKGYWEPSFFFEIFGFGEEVADEVDEGELPGDDSGESFPKTAFVVTSSAFRRSK